MDGAHRGRAGQGAAVTDAPRYRVTLDDLDRWTPPVRDHEAAGYYGQQVLLSGPWHWLVTWYFWLGGISGASYVVAVLARWFGGSRAKDVARAGHLVSILAIAPAPALLVLDLGRKARFHHMLRVFKPRSPMNLGAWALTLFGFTSGLSAWHELADLELLPGPLGAAGRRVPADAVAAVGATAGIYFSGYTGTLLATTAIPLWARTPMLGGLFMASAAATGSAAIDGALALAGRGATGLRVPAAATLAGEVALSEAYVRALGPAGRPLREGRAARWFRAYRVVGLAVPIALAAAPGRDSRWSRAAAAAAVLAGGFCLRAAVVQGGHQSAADPGLVLG
jgi:formate-dependent nitrite reductase membrane component NrfD